MKINVIGLGYIGLPTALIFAAQGLEVVGTDYNNEVIKRLCLRDIEFKEDGLDELFSCAVDNGIEFTSEYIKADIYIVAVPTPYIEDNKKLDPTYLIEAIKSILNICKIGAIIVIESTISPGSIDRFIRPIIREKKFNIGKDVHLVHAPERIIPGNMIYEMLNNSRTIGADDLKIGQKIRELYASFCKGKIIVTDIRSAEMSKVVENTYRDINIAFANELAKICRVDNMDVYEIIKIANLHPRVHILKPGPGVGGHCISVDPWFLVGDYPDLTNLILSARKINTSMPKHVLKRIRDIMREHNINEISKVGLYGLTYKEDVDDIRESPTLQLLKRMDEHLAFGVKVFDPLVKKRIVEHQFLNFDDFINEVEIIVIMVSHRHLKEHLSTIKDKLILDTRNVCEFSGVYKL